MTPKYIWPSADDDSRQESADDISKQNNGSRDRLSFTPLYHYKVRQACKDLTLYQPCMCQRRGRTFDHIWYWGRARQENQHVVNFQSTEDKLVAIHSSPGEDT